MIPAQFTLPHLQADGLEDPDNELSGNNKTQGEIVQF